MHESNIYLIVTAAGSGTRMGSSVPKQFMLLDGKPVLRIVIERFLEAIPSLKVIVVLPREHSDWWKKYCITSNFDVPQIIVQGGITRFHSVKNALAKVPDGSIVAIHDGVRPLITVNAIRAMFGKIVKDPGCRAVIPVMPSTDTLKALKKVSGPDGSFLLADIPGVDIDRSCVWSAQTPQIFRSGDIKSAYALPYDPLFTDDASVAAKNNIPLTYVPGERFNIKLTVPEDLVLARAIMQILAAKE